MNEAKNSPLRVERLKIKHLSWFGLSTTSPKAGQLEIMLLKGWLSGLEIRLRRILPTRNPYTIIATEDNNPIAFIDIKPFNRRGTTWISSNPLFISQSQRYGRRQIFLKLLKTAIETEKIDTQSWLLNCDCNDTDNIEVARELGFKAIKKYKCWKPMISLIKNLDNNSKKALSNRFKWENIDHKNALLISKIEKASESIHIRNILDRQAIDLLDQRNKFTGVVLDNSSNNQSALLALLKIDGYSDVLNLFLVRDLALDSRLDEIIPKVLDSLKTIHSKLVLYTNEDDAYLTSKLESLGWTEFTNRTIFGRSIWKRSEGFKVIKGTQRLESLLEKLNPQQPPLPSPLDAIVEE